MDYFFNSVESAKAITFDNLNFNSVENVPGFEARAVFTLNSATVFATVGRGCFAVKEDVDIVPTIIDDTLSYVPTMPITISSRHKPHGSDIRHQRHA